MGAGPNVIDGSKLVSKLFLWDHVGPTSKISNARTSTKHFILVAVSCTKYLLVLFQMSLLSPPMNVLSFLGTKKVLDRLAIVYYISGVSLRENLIKG